MIYHWIHYHFPSLVPTPSKHESAEVKGIQNYTTPEDIQEFNIIPSKNKKELNNDQVTQSPASSGIIFDNPIIPLGVGIREELNLCPLALYLYSKEVWFSICIRNFGKLAT